MNMPGELGVGDHLPDGYQMARKGRAARSARGDLSFVAGTLGVVGLMLLAPPLAKVSLAFSSPEYFALMAFGLSMVVLLAGASLVKALLSMLVGLWIAGMGTDLFSATSRFTFGRAELLGGIDFTIVAIGVFAIGEELRSVEAPEAGQLQRVPRGIRNLLPTART
jgi:putative tricarboxylic transport membrane protein